MTPAAAAVDDDPAAATPEADGTSRGRLASLLEGGAWATVLAGAGMLAFGAFGGFFVRPAAEDYCVAWHERDRGFSGLVHYFYDEANGRLANAWVNGAVYAHGFTGPRLLPLLLAVLFTGGTFFLLRQLLRLGGREAPTSVLLAAAAGIPAAVLFSSKTIYQVFLWAPGSITHTVPALLALWTVVLGLHAWRRGRAVKGVALLVAFAVAFATGSLSEPFTAVSGVLALTALVVLLPGARRDPYRLAWPLTWLVGLVVGFVVLTTSPGMDHRTARPVDQPSLLSPDGIRLTLQDWGHVWSTVLHTPTYLATVLLGLLVGLACVRVVDAHDRPRRRWATTALVLLPAGLVVVTSLAVVAGLRLGYGPSGWKYERAWTNFTYPSALAAAFYGAAGGVLLRRARVLATPVGAAAAFTAAALASVVALLGLAGPLEQVVHRTAVRSAAWDAQDARIRAEVRAGATSVAFSPMKIDILSEPFAIRPYARDWVSGCVSRYYRVDRLTPAPPAYPVTSATGRP